MRYRKPNGTWGTQSRVTQWGGGGGGGEQKKKKRKKKKKKTAAWGEIPGIGGEIETREGLCEGKNNTDLYLRENRMYVESRDR